MNVSSIRFSPRRLFFRRRSRLASTLLVVAAVIVTACEQTPEPPRVDYTDHKVEWVAMSHEVAFVPDSASFAGGEMARIGQFLEKIDARLTDQIALDPGANVDNELAIARADTVAQGLRRRIPGVDVRILNESKGANAQIIVGRYVVAPPECAGFHSPEQRMAAFANPDNETDANFGCATESNLARMIADPADLIRGRDLAPGDARVLGASVDRYRKGESPHPHSTFSLRGSEVE